MKIGLFIAAMACAAVCLVQMKRGEVAVRHEIQQLELKNVRIRRDLWDRQVTLGRLVTPQFIRAQADAMAIDMIDKSRPGGTVASADRPVGAGGARAR
ncbi:MAG: hypothetical protein HZA50_03755 [Planctomycetes bacterium]|nr:hypothetical protein [Planctomycetota bacterium]